MATIGRAAGCALLLGCLAGCGETAMPQGEAREAQPDPAAAGADAEVMAQWARSCVLCHVNGEGGAPRLGRPEDWQPRLAQGEDVLLRHTIEGLNNMPPLGYCMDCERQDFVALIRFMAGGS